MNADSASARPALDRIGGMPIQAAAPRHRLCAVRLFDRRTGTLHRVNGSPLTILTRTPAEAVAELLQGRDPDIWEARIDPIEPEPRR